MVDTTGGVKVLWQGVCRTEVLVQKQVKCDPWSGAEGVDTGESVNLCQPPWGACRAARESGRRGRWRPGSAGFPVSQKGHEPLRCQIAQLTPAERPWHRDVCGEVGRAGVEGAVPLLPLPFSLALRDRSVLRDFRSAAMVSYLLKSDVDGPSSTGCRTFGVG